MLLLKPRFWPPSPTLPPRSTALRFAATVLVALAGVTVAVALPLLAEHRVVAWKGGKTLSPNFLWALTLALSQLAAAPATVADATQRRPKRARSEVLALPAPPDQHAH